MRLNAFRGLFSYLLNIVQMASIWAVCIWTYIFYYLIFKQKTRDMRKLILIISFVALSYSCAKEELVDPQTDIQQGMHNTFLYASTGAAKATLSEDYVKLSWSPTDTLSAYTSKGRFVDFVFDGNEDQEGVARFKGVLDAGEKIDRYVVFPTGKHSVIDGQLYVNFPDVYEYSEGDVRPLMLAEYESLDKILSFSHLGGMFAFDVVGMPEGANTFEFTATKAVIGSFPVDDGSVVSPDEEFTSKVTFTFPALEQVEDKKFFVPVPTGDYQGFTISISDGEEALFTKSSSKTNSIKRNNLKKFTVAASDIVYVTVTGSGAKTGASWADATTLTAALANAKDGQVLRLAGGTYIPDAALPGSTDNSDQHKTFYVNKHINIQGSYKEGTSQMDTLATPTIISGKIADGINAYHAMVVAAPGEGNVTLRGLRFSNASPLKANTAELIEQAVVTVADGIKVPDYRGALYLASDAVVRSCVISDNFSEIHSKTDGTLGVGMYVHSGVKALVENSTFAKNSGGACGGAISVAGTLTLNKVLFDGNTACHSGAVHSNGVVSVSNCVFNSNEARNGFAGALRIQGSRADVQKSVFVGNISHNHGGAIQINRNQMTTIKDCLFKDNTAVGAYGGAIANWGGAISTISNSTFVANKAEVTDKQKRPIGGAIVNMYQTSSSDLTLSKCIFEGDAYSEGLDAVHGGALANLGSSALVEGCSFNGLNAEFGGAVSNEYAVDGDNVFTSDLKVDKGCEFHSNIASYGGALANLGGVSATVAKSDFEKNKANVHGGALYNATGELTDSYSVDGSPVITITSVDFISNSSEKNGGAAMNLYAGSLGLDAPRMTVSHSNFTGNAVSQTDNEYARQGGAIANQCSVLVVDGSSFTSNSAYHSGAIYSYDMKLNEKTPLSDKVAYTYVYNSSFEGNTVKEAGKQGSHYRAHGKGMNLLVNSTFKGGNSTTGAIRLRTGANCWTVSCTFSENASGIYNQSSFSRVYNTISYGNGTSGKKLNYFANNADGEDAFCSSLIGEMSLDNRYNTTGNYLFDVDGQKEDYTLKTSSPLNSYKDGVYSINEKESVLLNGMTNSELNNLAAEIKTSMPDLQEKYFTRDQKNSPRDQREKVMGAYIGEVYLDPNREGFLNGTELNEDMNLRGLITDNSGKPVPGVAVSDGYDVVQTDANGVYQFEAHQDARLLSISVPAEYEIPYKNNRPDMWVRIDPTDYEIRTDFVLNKRLSPVSDFTVFSLADTHVKTADHYVRFSTETMADLERTVNSGAYDPNSFAVILGDIMFDNYEQVEKVKASLVKARVPVFPCFGNHDSSSSVGTTELDLISKYQQHFGPVDYSFNIGKVHFVFMKNMIYEGEDPYGTEGHKYNQGFLDHQVEWLKKDLAAVEDKKDKMVILCVHIPLRNSGNGSKNYKAVVQQLLQFGEVHVFSGHHHGVYNHIAQKDVTVAGKTFYDHNQIAAAGAWWNSNLNPDGSPNGYMIYDISGNTLRNHTLKGTNLSAGYQMRVYDGGESFKAPLEDKEWWNNAYNFTLRASWKDNLSADLAGKFVVHVFNADVRDWKVYFVQNGVRTEMTRTTDNWYDVASYAYAGFYTDWTGGGKNRYSTAVENTNFWYIAAPSGDPSKETGWKIEAVHTYDGRTVVYTADKIHTKYSGFADMDFTDTVSLEGMTEDDYEFTF